MKITLLTLAAFLFIGKIAYATSCPIDKNDFATVYKHFKDSNIYFVSGKGIVIESNIEFVRLKIREVYNSGALIPLDSVITVHNAFTKTSSPFDPTRIIKANDYFIKGGTVVFISPKIVKKVYVSDVVGEFRIRPDSLDAIMNDVCLGQYIAHVSEGIIVRVMVELSTETPLVARVYTDYEFRRYIGIITGLTSSELQKEEFSLFPNPTDNLLNITLNKPCLGCKVEILDSYSKSVFEKPYEDVSLDISNLKSGLYYFLLKDENKTVGSSKFVKK